MVVEWVNEDKMRSTCCKAGEAYKRVIDVGALLLLEWACEHSTAVEGARQSSCRCTARNAKQMLAGGAACGGGVGE
jgi:hypothetical protein